MYHYKESFILYRETSSSPICSKNSLSSIASIERLLFPKIRILSFVYIEKRIRFG